MHLQCDPQTKEIFPKKVDYSQNIFHLKECRNGKNGLVLMIYASPERLVGIEEDDFGE